MDYVLDSLVELNQHTLHPQVLGKRAERIVALHKLKLTTPKAFAITPNAFVQFTSLDNLHNKLEIMIKNADKHDPHALTQVSRRLHTLITTQSFEPELLKQLQQSFHRLIKSGVHQLVPSLLSHQEHSASQPIAVLKGDVLFLKTIRQIWADQFTPKAISEYQFHHHLPLHTLVVIEVEPAQVSGILTTIHPHTNQKSSWYVEAYLGMTQDKPGLADTFIIDKQNGQLQSQHIVRQDQELHLNHRGQLKFASIRGAHQKAPKLTVSDLKNLAASAHLLTSHTLTPLTISFTKIDSHLHINDYLPFEPAIPGIAQSTSPQSPHSHHASKLLARGLAASPGIITAPVRVVDHHYSQGQLDSGEIVVTTFATAKILPLFRKASGIITELGGPTSHAAIIAREVGCPAVTSIPKITSLLKTGDVVTINGSTGEIFLGSPASSLKTQPSLPKPTSTELSTATKVMISLSSSSSYAFVSGPIDGVGLVRGDIIFTQFGLHPKAIESQKKSRQYREYLTDILDQICSRHPHLPVIYSPTNLYSSAYQELTGSSRHEPAEPNPLLGYHGALRLITDPYLFDLELETIAGLRTAYHYPHLYLTLPFIRTIQELQTLKRLIALKELRRGGSFKLFLTLETPASLLTITKFIDQGIDGVIINTNQLAALTVGFDPNNPEVNQFFTPNHEAVLKLIRFAADACHPAKIPCLVTGQALAPSPDIFDHLVKWGVSGVIVDPNQAHLARHYLHQAETHTLK